MDFKVVNRTVEVEVEGLDTLVTVVDGVRSEINIREFMKIHDEDLSMLQNQLATNPADYAYYSSVLAWYQYRQDEIQYELEKKISEADLVLRNDPRHGGAKEREFKSLLEKDAGIAEKREDLAKVGYVVKKLQSFVRAIEKKGDRMVQIYSRLKYEEGQHKYL